MEDGDVAGSMEYGDVAGQLDHDVARGRRSSSRLVQCGGAERGTTLRGAYKVPKGRGRFARSVRAS
jgi:hypothetical protein